MEANNRQLGSHRSAVQASRPLESPGAPELGVVAFGPCNTGKDEPGGIVPRHPGHVSDGVLALAAAGHMREGSFASGQETIEHHPERPAEKGDFAAGEEQQKHTHQGSFAQGQQAADPHPEFAENRGNFAAGQRARVHILPGTGGLPSFW
jgi:hypothetical protein